MMKILLEIETLNVPLILTLCGSFNNIAQIAQRLVTIYSFPILLPSTPPQHNQTHPTPVSYTHLTLPTNREV